jgi:hypothetical protein
MLGAIFRGIGIGDQQRVHVRGLPVSRTVQFNHSKPLHSPWPNPDLRGCRKECSETRIRQSDRNNGRRMGENVGDGGGGHGRYVNLAQGYCSGWQFQCRQ